MSLSLRDKIALIYTGAGSQRRVAQFVGVSHQRIGRILNGEAGLKLLTDPDVRAAVDIAFSIHKQVTRQQAKAHALPYDAKIPVFQQRMPLKVSKRVLTGRRKWDEERGEYVPEIKTVPVRDANGRPVVVPGDRVAALHTHHLSNEQRNAWITAMHASGKFIGASIASIVNLVTYSKAAERLRSGLTNDPQKVVDRLTILLKIEDARDALRNQAPGIDTRTLNQQVVQGMLYTKVTPMTFNLDFVLNDINQKLQSKHAPHTGELHPATKLASNMLLQVDTRKDQNGESRDKEFRSRAPYKGPTIKRKTRGNKARGKRGKASR